VRFFGTYPDVHTESAMKNERPALFSPGPGKRGMTKLHYAAYCGDGDALARCIATGMNPNQQDKYRGYTALLWLMDMAATGGPRLEMFRTLVSHGADIHIRATDGTSALKLARAAGTQSGDDLAAALVALGATE
jgi:ankyrin repeat protein